MVAAGRRRIGPNHPYRPEPALSIRVAETFSQPAPSRQLRVTAGPFARVLGRLKRLDVNGRVRVLARADGRVEPWAPKILKRV